MTTWRRSLACRLTLLVSATVLVVAAGSGYVGARLEQAALLARIDQEAGRLADLLAASSAQALFTFQTSRLESIVLAYTKDPGIRRVEIRDSSGSVVMQAGEAKDGGALVLASRDSMAGGQRVGSVSVGLSREPVEAAVRRASTVLAVREVAGLLIVMVLLTLLVAREVSRPLARLDAVLATAQATGDLTVRLPRGGRTRSAGSLRGSTDSWRPFNRCWPG